MRSVNGLPSKREQDSLMLKSKPPQRLRTRWSLFEGTQLASWSSVEFSQIVDEHLAQTALLLDYYTPPIDTPDLSQFKLTSISKAFTLRISKTLNLNQELSFKLLQSYVASQISLKQDLHGDLSYDDTLLHGITSHYYREREATILFISALFRAAGYEHHRYHQKATDAVKTLLGASTPIQDLVLKQFKAAASQALPLNIESVEAREWTTANLKEQKASLELMSLIYYESAICDGPTALKVITVLLESNLGYKRINIRHYDDEGVQVSARITHLCAVLVVELLNFEQLLGLVAVDLQTPEVNSLYGSPKMLTGLDKLIWDSVPKFSGGSCAAGILCMAWASYCQYIVMLLSTSCPESYTEFFTIQSQIHTSARNPQLLFQGGYTRFAGIKFVSHMFGNRGILTSEDNELAYKSIMSGFWNALLTTQNVLTLPDRPMLITSFSNLYTNTPELCKQFWTQDLQVEEYRSLLDAARRSFPIDFWSFSTMLASLIADAETAWYAFEYMKILPSFADFKRDSDYDLSMESSSNDIFVWRGSNLIKNARTYPLDPPHMTVGYIVGPDVLLLDWEYSGWHALQSFIDSFLCSQGMDSPGRIVGTVETTLEALKLFNLILKYADETMETAFLKHLFQAPVVNQKMYGSNAPEKLLSMVSGVLNRCCGLHPAPTELITCAMNTMTYFLRRYPHIIWTNLRAQRLLPQNASGFSSTSFMQQIVIPAECAVGIYDATIAFLDLIYSLVKEAQLLTTTGEVEMTGDLDLEWVRADLLSSSVTFILRELFSSYSTWRYAHIDHKFQIGLRILKIFNIIMRDTTWFIQEKVSSSDHRVSILQKILFNSFTKQGASYQISPLLDILALGKETPINYHKVHKKLEASHIEESIVLALNFLKAILLRLVHVDEGISTLESCIFDRSSAMPNGKQMELIEIIAGYITYEYNTQCVLHSAEILNLLCTLANKEGRPTMSLVGYFGGEAFSLASNFVTLVNDESLNTARDEPVQMAIFSFVTTAIMTQPGLGAMFLTGTAPQSISLLTEKGTIVDKSIILETSILHPALLAINSWKTYRKSKPTVLAAAINLIDLVWQKGSDHLSTINKLRNHNNLWDSLIAIINEPIGASENLVSYEYCYFQVAQAHALRILVSEAHFSSTNGAANELLKKISESLNLAIFNESAQSERFLVKKTQEGQLVSFPFDPELTQKMMQLFTQLNLITEFGDYRSIVWNDPFDTSRPYGVQFVYDVNLFLEKVDYQFDEDIESVEGEVVNLISRINKNWSQTDSYLVMLRSYCFSVRLIVSRIWPMAKESKLDIPSTTEVYNLILGLLRLLSEHQNESFMHVTYQEELASLIFFILGYWIPIVIVEQKFEPIINMLLEILGELVHGLNLNVYSLGPSGYLSKNFPFHSHIFASFLIIFQNISKLFWKDTQYFQRLNDLYKEVVSAICEGLHFILTGDSKDDGTDLSILVASLYEITRPEYGVSLSIWQETVDKYQIIPLLLNIFSQWQLSASGNLIGKLSNAPEQILEVLLSFASQAISAERLLSHGIMAIFCNNALTPVLCDGAIESYPEATRSYIHKMWCLMLAIVTQLLHYRGQNVEFYEYAVGFSRLYHSQFSQCMLNNNIESNLSKGVLEETERTTELYFYIARYLSFFPSIRENHLPSVVDFKEKSMKVLSIYGFLFKSPLEMAARLKRLSNEQKGYQGGESEETYKTFVDAKILAIIRNTLHFLRLSTNALSLLTLDSALLSDSDLTPVLQPSMTLLSDQSASFGTIFDFIRDMTQRIRKQVETAKKPLNTATKTSINELSSILESSLIIIVSQLVILSQSEGDMKEIWEEISQEYGKTLDDLKSLLIDAEQAWGVDVLSETKKFVLFLQSPAAMELVKSS